MVANEDQQLQQRSAQLKVKEAKQKAALARDKAQTKRVERRGKRVGGQLGAQAGGAAGQGAGMAAASLPAAGVMLGGLVAAPFTAGASLGGAAKISGSMIRAGGQAGRQAGKVAGRAVGRQVGKRIARAPGRAKEARRKRRLAATRAERQEVDAARKETGQAGGAAGGRVAKYLAKLPVKIAKKAAKTVVLMGLGLFWKRKWPLLLIALALAGPIMLLATIILLMVLLFSGSDEIDCQYITTYPWWHPCNTPTWPGGLAPNSSGSPSPGVSISPSPVIVIVPSPSGSPSPSGPPPPPPPPPPGEEFVIAVINESTVANPETVLAAVTSDMTGLQFMVNVAPPWSEHQAQIRIKTIVNTQSLGCTIIITPGGWEVPSCPDLSLIVNIVSQSEPDWDTIIVVANAGCDPNAETQCGSVADNFPPLAAVSPNVLANILAHELGHTVGKMNDEYFGGRGLNQQPRRSNCFVTGGDCRAAGMRDPDTYECIQGCNESRTWRPASLVMYLNPNATGYGSHETCLLNRKLLEALQLPLGDNCFNV